MRVTVYVFHCGGWVEMTAMRMAFHDHTAGEDARQDGSRLAPLCLAFMSRVTCHGPIDCHISANLDIVHYKDLCN